MGMSRRVLSGPHSGIRTMFALAEGYGDLANLGVGEPDFRTPEHIVEAAIRALREGKTRYTPNAGIPELREALAEKLERENGLRTDPASNLLVTTGACEAIMLSILAVTDPGDEVLVPDPCWPNYLGQIHFAGARAVPVRTFREDRFHLRADRVEAAITGRTRALLFGTPSNPTGSALEREELVALAEVARRHDLMVISDEPYEKLIYDGRAHVSIGSLPGMAERTLTVNSFSKSYAMTGWRVGYVHGPSGIIPPMVKMQENYSSCVNATAQYACVAALRGPQDATATMAESYRRRRDLLVSGLNSIPGISCLVPEGAFYAFPDVSALGRSSEELARDWLKRIQVVAVPGNAFGDAGEGFLRMCYAASEETIRTALDRIRSIL